MRRFLEHAEDDSLSLLWFLLVETGMRRGEALGLHWSSVDWSTPAVTINHTAVQNKVKGEAAMRIQPHGKTRSARRTILISDDLLQLFRDWRKKDTTSILVFPNASGNPLTDTWVRKRLRDLAERAGVPQITIHELRHTAATRMMRAGVPMVVAQQRMGHTSAELLQHVYQHADAEAQRAAVDALSALSQMLPSDAVKGGSGRGSAGR